MVKNEMNANMLIKRSGLARFARQKNIRIGKGSLAQAEKSIASFTHTLLAAAKENMITHGRRTLKKEDITDALIQLRQEEKTLLDVSGK